MREVKRLIDAFRLEVKKGDEFTTYDRWDFSVSGGGPVSKIYNTSAAVQVAIFEPVPRLRKKRCSMDHYV